MDAFPHAAAAFAPGILAALPVADVAALEAFAARALDDPRAQPATPAEVAAWCHLQRVVERQAGAYKNQRRGRPCRRA